MVHPLLPMSYLPSPQPFGKHLEALSTAEGLPVYDTSMTYTPLLEIYPENAHYLENLEANRHHHQNRALHSLLVPGMSSESYHEDYCLLDLAETEAPRRRPVFAFPPSPFRRTRSPDDNTMDDTQHTGHQTKRRRRE